MRILLVTRDDPRSTLTGVAVYTRDLAAALARECDEVTHLYIGRGTWRPARGPRWSSEGGVQYMAIRGGSSSRGALRECLGADVSSPALEARVGAVIQQIHPDLVHLHDLAGLPAMLIPAVRARGCRVVVTLHDFWPFCRQLLLIRPGLVPCDGSDGGHNCARACAFQPRGLRHRLRVAEATFPSARVRTVLRRTRLAYHRIRGRHGSQFALSPSPGAPADRAPVLEAAYAEREVRMRSALLQADVLLTVSRFAQAVYVRHGYPADRIGVLPLSLAATDHIPRRTPRVPVSPVRFGYVGSVTPWKGAQLLAQASAGISPALARFTFYGAVAEEDRRFLLDLAGGGERVRFYGRYTREQLPGILEEIDVAVFPSIMRETQGLVGLEARAAGVPIIGAAHGAIPEYVRHGVNGLLFEPGSAASLREQISRVLEDPESVARMSSNVLPPQPMSAHVHDVMRLYAEALRVPAPAAGTAVARS
jgi:glycosyltransferase involved in cell wall biosynthesis